MFEQTFRIQLALLTDDSVLVEKLWNEIKSSYLKAGRHYHSLPHLDHLLTELLPVQNVIHDWQTLVFSVAYHDITYNVRKNDNEEKSAQVARARFSVLPVAPGQPDKCFLQIMATKGHAMADDDDTNLFTDADLSILGSGNDTYNRYTKMIRQEYKVYPTLIYKPGRQKVLRSFLQMPHIYKTAFFQHKYEEQARANLTRELKELSF